MWGLLALLSLGVTPATPPFQDATERWGLAFRHHHAGSGSFYMVETMGSGVLVWDYDRDGDEDVLFVDSGLLPGYEGPPPRTVLFRNEGGGRFVDATARSGLRVARYGMGATAGDVDGDGEVDVYLTAFGGGQLFRSRGDGRFADDTARAGLGGEAWATSAAFADPDRDGDLDLYVAQYVDFSLDNNPICGVKERGLRSYCHPDAFDGLPDRYFANKGDGTFVDATSAASLAVAPGKGLGVVFADLDDDGWADLYVANDMTPNFLFRNRRDGRFEEIAIDAGVALSDLGKEEAGMGVEAADLDGDGRLDLFVTHLDLQSNALYKNLGDGLFTDARYASRLAEPSIYFVGFGVAAEDFDQDGDLDLAVANGHIVHNIEVRGTGATYKQRNQLFWNDGAGRFTEARPSGLDAIRASRGLATGDLDGDGDLDFVVTDNDDTAEVYENVGAAGGWLGVDLEAAQGNRRAIGARVTVEAGGRRLTREVRTASSYLSQSALTVHFGLGSATRVDRLTIRWPEGRRQAIVGLPANRRVVVLR